MTEQEIDQSLDDGEIAAAFMDSIPAASGVPELLRGAQIGVPVETLQAIKRCFERIAAMLEDDAAIVQLHRRIKQRTSTRLSAGKADCDKAAS